MSNENGLYELPNGWQWVKLDVCVEILDAQRKPINTNERQKRIEGKKISQLYPYYGATGHVGLIDNYIFNEELVLLGEDGAPFLEPYKTKAYIIKGKSWVNNHAHVLKAINNLMTNQFLCYYLNNTDYHQYVTGTTRLKLNQSRMKEILICIPPLEEQKRIVAKIEELFTELDAGVELLKKLQIKLKRYRQSVLKAAVEGNLTTEWRAENQDKLEPANQLLDRILKERREKWEAEQLAKFTAQGKYPKDDSWKLKYQEPSPPDISNLPILPDSWLYVKADLVSDFITKGTTPAKEYLFDNSGDIPFLKVYNLTDNGKLDFSIKPTFVPLEIHQNFLNRSKVLSGDVLMNIVGPPLGKVSLVTDQFSEWNINQAIARYRTFKGLYNKYLLYYLLSKATIDRLAKRAKATAGQFNLTLEICRDAEIPICSLEEQFKIVEEIELRLSVIDQIQTTIQTNLKRAEKLRQSILKQAFQGKLVEQDPNDEPAAKLLERIKAEKAKEEPKRISKRKPKEAAKPNKEKEP